MSKSNSVIEKICHLLAKTEAAGCSLAEAETAARLAQRLMSQYQLEMADIEVAGDDTGQGEINSFGIDELSGNRIAPWKKDLITAVAKTNGCYSYTNKSYAGFSQRNYKTVSTFMLVGLESDVMMVKAFFISLVNTIEGMSKREQPAGLERGEGRRWAGSFKLGATRAIINRLFEAVSEVKEEATSSAAIVKVDNKVKDAHDWVNNNLKLKKAPVSRIQVNAEAYSAGVAAGNRVGLTKRALA